jgi:hypothetical protein
MALGGEAVEVLVYGSADPGGLWPDYATVRDTLAQHPAVGSELFTDVGSGLVAELKARARALLSAPDAVSAVHALAAALEQAGALDGAAIEAHLRHLPRCQWALARPE